MTQESEDQPKTFGRKKKGQIIFKKTKRKWQEEDKEIEKLTQKYPEIVPAEISQFSHFPFSHATHKGLKEAGFLAPTDIQRESIGLALQGNDILGAAKTGSGKTLSFLLPILELLYRKRWSPTFGLGALVISPTRELAYQIFEVLRKVGKYHDFSAGLVIGGKELQVEAKLINKTNIVICTPGRILQHMHETHNFQCDDLEMLVLDEADRILDMGFAEDLDAILANLSITRQTMLFSATQTKSIKDLARLSLKNPMYVSVHEHDKHSTPEKLTQSFIVCDAHEKIDIVWSFMKSHLRSKILIFVQTCKEVRYLYHLFCRLRPGVSILGIHGHMKQTKRIEMYDMFCSRKRAVLFATDVASRGLDFPAVNWVVQMDCPEDCHTYIHRAGRTARFEEGGEALLMLTPNEEKGMVCQLRERKIPINKIQVNVSLMKSIGPKIASLLAADPEIKMAAQRAFLSYIRSCHVMSDKNVFDVKNLDFDSLAQSYGMVQTPRIRFLERKEKGMTKAVKLKEQQDTEEKGEMGTDEKEVELEKEEDVLTTVKSKSDFEVDEEDEDEDVEDMLILKKKHVDHLDNEETPTFDEEKKRRKKAVTKEDVARRLKNKGITANVKTLFDEEGDAVRDRLKPTTGEDEGGGLDLGEAEKRMKEEDKVDKQRESERVKRMHREQKVKEKEKMRKEIEQKKSKKEEGEGEEMDIVFKRRDEDEAFDPELLPDPDKLLAKRGENQSDESGGSDSDQSEEGSDIDDVDESEEEDEEYEEEETIPAIAEFVAKRKWKAPKKPKEIKEKRRRIEVDDNEAFDTGLSLLDDESLALQLLQS